MPIDSQPRDAEKARAAAFALYFGKTVAEAAAEARVSETTIRNWTASSWWPELIAAVESEALEYLQAKARGVLLDKLIEGDAISARWLLERRDRQFAPPKKTVEVEGRVEHDHRALAPVPTATIERLADMDDDAIEAFFEEIRPLGLPEH